MVNMVVVSTSLSIAHLIVFSIWTTVECTPSISNTAYTLVATKDVLMDRGTKNFNYENALIIGKHPGYPKKRSLLQFPDISNDCTNNVVSAKMYIWYWYSHRASGQSDAQVPHLSHVLKAHQIKKEWVETEATSSYRKNGISWSQQWLGLDGIDADATPLDSVLFPNPPPSGDNRWIEFNITSAAQNWANGQPNYGVVIWSNRENDSGRDLRFYSRERSSNRPYVNVLCSTIIESQSSTVVLTDTDLTSHTESNGFNTFSIQSESPSAMSNDVGYKQNITMEITVSSNYGTTVTTYSKNENINMVSVPVVSSTTVTPTRDTTTNSIYTTAHYSMYSSSYSSSVFGDHDISFSTLSSGIQMILPSTNSSISPSIIGVIVGCICAGVFVFIILPSVTVCIVLYSAYSVHLTSSRINPPISPSTTMNQVYGIMSNSKPLPSTEHTREEPEQQINICYNTVKHQGHHNGGGAGSSGAGSINPLYEEINTIHV